MNSKDFKPAKVIGRVDLKSAGGKQVPEDVSPTLAAAPDANVAQLATDPSTTPQETGGEDAHLSVGGVGLTGPTTEPVREPEIAADPMTEIIIDSTRHFKDMEEQGIAIGTIGTSGQKPTVSQMVAKVQEILVTFVIKGLEEIGAYFLTHVFDGNYKKALSKDPYKGTSLNDLARHKNMPLSRQRLGECIRVAGVTAELKASGLDLDHLTFYHKVEISRLRTPEARAKMAGEANTTTLTVHEVRDRVRKLTSRASSADKRLAHTVINQLEVLSRLSVDEEAREFLQDKDRLKAALTSGETAKMLDSSEKFRDAMADSEELLHQLEKTLVEIVVERRQEDIPEPEKTQSNSTG